MSSPYAMPADWQATPIGDALDAELDSGTGVFAPREPVARRVGAHAYPASLPETAPEPGPGPDTPDPLPEGLTAAEALEGAEQAAAVIRDAAPRVPTVRAADRPAVPQTPRRRDRGGRAAEKESR